MNILQWVLPKHLIPMVLTKLHNEMGHLGRDRVLANVREIFHFCCMTKQVEEWISAVVVCASKLHICHILLPLLVSRLLGHWN